MKGILRSGMLILICCSAVLYGYAQSSTNTIDSTKKNTPRIIHQTPPKGPKAIKNELSVGFRLNTNGWSAYTDIGKVKALDSRRSDMFYKTRVLQVEFTEKKDPKEEKITSDIASSSGGSSKYIYGKINNFYALKLGLGFTKMIAGKPDPGTVSIHWLNVVGLSLGMLKPYYLNVDVQGNADAFKYTPDTEPYFLDQQSILGSAGFSKGLSEIKFIPGGHFKSALHFDFSTNRKNIFAAEAGLNVEYYSQAIALMANQSGAPYFVDLFIAIQFGRRW